MNSAKRKNTTFQIPKASKNITTHPRMILFPKTCTGYENLWLCKTCQCFIVSENGILPHVAKCKEKHDPPPAPIAKPAVTIENIFHTCEICKKTFSRFVVLKKHLKDHENKKQVDSDEEVIRRRRKPRKKLTAKQIKMEIFSDSD